MKTDFVSRFGKNRPSKEKIECAVSGSLDAADFLLSLFNMNSLFKIAGFDENEKLGFLRTAVMEHPELSLLFVYRSPHDYTSLKASVLSFALVKKAICAGSSSHRFALQKTTQRSDVTQRKTEDKIDVLASQPADLTLIVKNL